MFFQPKIIEESVSTCMVSEMAKSINIVLTVPVTTATAEQTFPTLKQPKSYLRSTVTQPHLNNLMLLHTHEDITDKNDILQIAKEFLKVNEQRMLLNLCFNHHWKSVPLITYSVIVINILLSHYFIV